MVLVNWTLTLQVHKILFIFCFVVRIGEAYSMHAYYLDHTVAFLNYVGTSRNENQMSIVY